MNPPQNILVPTDFSDCANQALDYAVAFAAKVGATVHLLYAMPAPTFGVPELSIPMQTATIDHVARHRQTRLDEIAETHRGTVEMGEVVMRTGDALERERQPAGHPALVVIARR